MAHSHVGGVLYTIPLQRLTHFPSCHPAALCSSVSPSKCAMRAAGCEGGSWLINRTKEDMTRTRWTGRVPLSYPEGVIPFLTTSNCSRVLRSNAVAASAVKGSRARSSCRIVLSIESWMLLSGAVTGGCCAAGGGSFVGRRVAATIPEYPAPTSA